MGDLSAEPSMEEILSSIKRIIAEEGDQPARRGRPARAPAVPLATLDDEEVLELSEPLAAPAEPLPLPRAERAEPRPDPRPEPRSEPRPVQETRAMPSSRATPAPPEPIVSSEAAAASRGALETLGRLLVKPDPGNDGTLEGLVREMLRPMLREWLDAHLPDMVETMVAREIKRIAAAA